MALGLLLSAMLLQAGGDAVPWAKTPSAQDVAAAYPPAAMAENIAGSGVLECTVGAAGELTGCKGEGPGDYGFGPAAVALAPKFQVAVDRPEGKTRIGGTVRVPVRWVNEAKLKSPPIIVYDDAQRNGQVAMNCRTKADRSIDNCVVVEVRPRGANLIGQAGEAALRQKAPVSAPPNSRILLVVEVKAAGR